MSPLPYSLNIDILPRRSNNGLYEEISDKLQYYRLMNVMTYHSVCISYLRAINRQLLPLFSELHLIVEKDRASTGHNSA